MARVGDMTIPPSAIPGIAIAYFMADLPIESFCLNNIFNYIK
jgi:hypothetical protein